MTFALRFSRTLAAIYGILIVLLETIRRKTQLADPSAFLLWFDDYLLGGFLLWSAWKAVQDTPQTGARYLAAAWGMAVGAMFLSFRGQVMHVDQPDVTTLVSSTTVAAIKGALFAIALVCLLMSLRDPRRVR